MKSRRKFIKQTTIALAGAALASNKVFSMARASKETLGLQLYTVRDDMKTDPSGTLKKVAAIGYKYVEHANYVDGKFYGYTPVDFKKLLSDLNLDMISGHCVMTMKDWDDATNDVTDVWKKTVEDAATVGQKYVVSPWMDEKARTDMDLLKKFMMMFNKSGELCKAHGMKFGYHNHDFEFTTKVGDENLYDYILKNTDPNLVAQQMDIGNMYGAGGRALDILKAHPGRFELMHVKDEIPSTSGGEMGDKFESTVLGKGVVGTKEIVDYARKHGGTTQFIIEQESYQSLTPVESAKEDFDIMKSWGF
ncbi:MAG TPA: sugar phosphate isomerase/epimerase family protein [Parafilimonas sp.]|nr:sugar phosphate isomerase/epimerase family protein [Parafilimonas sp.]